LTAEDRTGAYAEALRRFAARHSTAAFRQAVSRPFAPRGRNGSPAPGSPVAVAGTTTG
jgi:hypothetical protein